MIVVLFGSTASYHHIGKLLSIYPSVEKVFHFGANSFIAEEEKYKPIPLKLPFDQQVSADEISVIKNQLSQITPSFVLTSTISIMSNDDLQKWLKENCIPCLFVDPNITFLEKDRALTKSLLESLKIPTAEYKKYKGRDLFDNWNNFPRPFVLKLQDFFHGRQTVIVNDDNFKEVYLDLFSAFLNSLPRSTNIGMESLAIIEEYIDLKKEFTYIALLNKENWQYIGAARDYKRAHDGDVGANTIGMGAYNLLTVDHCVHEYMDKIYKKLKQRLSTKGQCYKGFISLNIGVREDGVPVILEINTRACESEIDVIAGTITNLPEVLLSASLDQEIIPAVLNDKKFVSVRLVNKTTQTTRLIINIGLDRWFLPNLLDSPSSIDVSLQGDESFFVYHSLLTAEGNTHLEASNTIYNYLNSKTINQYYWRKDVGVLI